MSFQALFDIPDAHIPSELLNLVKLYDSGNQTLSLYTNFINNFSDYLVQQGFRTPDYAGVDVSFDPPGHVIKYFVHCSMSEHSNVPQHSVFIHMHSSCTLTDDVEYVTRCCFGISVTCNGSGACPKEIIGSLSLGGLFDGLKELGLRDEFVKGVIDG